MRDHSTDEPVAGCSPPPADASAGLVATWRELQKAQKASLKAAAARHRLPPGSTRARVTTANANWARAAEHRDRVQERYQRELETLARAEP
jgi:hypothetical protein